VANQTCMNDLPTDVRLAYRDLANDPKYQHFVRIPDRILQCIDYFEIDCDREITGARLQAYYLFIGVVDDAIDSGRIDTGNLILQHLATPAPRFDQPIASRAGLVTEILKFYICDQSYPLMLDKLRELYKEVVSERSATSIGSYIGNRNSIGALTAELSYLLILPGLNRDGERLSRFMQHVGAIGCLIDSLIDLHRDRQLGLLAFTPGLTDYASLIVTMVRDGLNVTLRHPRLFQLFLRAVIDNTRDPFRAQPVFTRRLISDMKDKTAGVA
jgi:hypothetical protein